MIFRGYFFFHIVNLAAFTNGAKWRERVKTGKTVRGRSYSKLIVLQKISNYIWTSVKYIFPMWPSSSSISKAPASMNRWVWYHKHVFHPLSQSDLLYNTGDGLNDFTDKQQCWYASKKRRTPDEVMNYSRPNQTLYLAQNLFNCDVIIKLYVKNAKIQIITWQRETK